MAARNYGGGSACGASTAPDRAQLHNHPGQPPQYVLEGREGRSALRSGVANCLTLPCDLHCLVAVRAGSVQLCQLAVALWQSAAPALAGGVHAGRPVVEDEFHAVLDCVPLGTHQDRHGLAGARRLLHVDGPRTHGGNTARRSFSMGCTCSVQEYSGAGLYDAFKQPSAPSTGVPQRATTKDVQHGLILNIGSQVAPLSASQQKTSAGLFVLPEATHSSEHSFEAASLQQLCMDSVVQRLQPSVVCSTLQVQRTSAQRTIAL